MVINKRRNVQRNIIFGIINKLIMMIFPFIIRTIIILKLGVDYVGLSSLFTSLLQVLSLAELGFGTAIVYSMYKPIIENDVDLMCALLNTYRKIYKIIGLIILIIGLLITPYLRLFISSDTPADINIYVLFLIYLLNTIISYLLFGYKQSLLFAHQRNDIESNILSFTYIIMYVLQIIALVVTKNYYYYIILIPICTISINLIRNTFVTKMFPQYQCSGELPLEIKNDMKKRVFGLLLTRLCQVSRNSLDSIVLSTFLGLTVLGKYQNYYYIINTITGFLNIITTSIVAGIGHSMLTKSIDENYKEFNDFRFFYNWISSWCTVCLLCLYQPFMKIWVGTDNLMPDSLVILMCLYFYILRIGDVISVYKEAAGIYWEDRYRPIFESITNLILNLLFVYEFGVYGVIVATIMSITFINIPWATIILHKTYFKRSYIPYFTRAILNTLVLILVSAITYGLCMLCDGNLYMTLIYRGVICILVPNLIMVSLNIKNPNLKLIFFTIKKSCVRKFC